MTNNITFYDRQYNMISGELLFSDHSVLQASVKHFQEYITEMKVEHTIIPLLTVKISIACILHGKV